MKKALLYTIRPLEPNELYTRLEMKMQTYTKHHQIEIVKYFSDIGYPASNLKRPALNELVKFLSNVFEKMDMVLFYGLEHFEKDIARIHYVESLIKSHVNEVLFINDSLFVEERASGERESS